MSIEIQFQSSILGTTIARTVQMRLRGTCFTPLSTGYIDHADVVGTVEVNNANGKVRFRVPIDVFFVSRADVLAAPNGVPAGAKVPAGRVGLILEMAVTGTILSLQSVDAELGPLELALGPDAPAAKTAIVNAVGSPIRSDLTAPLQQLGMGTPRSSRIEVSDSIVAVRFEPAGAAVTHLFPGQDWGVFLDGPAVELLAKSKFPSGLGSKITSPTINAHWRPVGSAPHVDVDFSGKAMVPDPLTASVDGTFTFDFSLSPLPFRKLRTLVNWSIHVDLGDLPAFIEREVREAIESSIRSNMVKAGGVPAGDDAFTLDTSLSIVSFGLAQLGYSSVIASPAGMTIGGPVRVPLDPSRETVKPSVTPFGLPFRLELCSVLARSGSGAPTPTVSLNQVKTTGRVWLDDAGAFCAVELVSPDWISPYLVLPPAGVAFESDEIRMVIPSGVALAITKPVRAIVRTARGVRLIDFGIPPPVKVDNDGNVTNAVVTFIDDCLYVPVGNDPFQVEWGTDDGDPTINPTDWVNYLNVLTALDVQLVKLSGLGAGELIQFRSRDHAVDVTADLNGRATVPVILPLTNDVGRATLTRVNRSSLAGRLNVDTAIFQRQATLPAGLRNSLTASDDGTALLTTEFKDRADVHEIGTLGVTTLVAPNQLQQTATAAGRSVRETGEKAHSSTGQCVDVPGILCLHRVPGFADEPIAIAVMEDGSMLILDLSQNGAARVAGTFTGPVGALDVSGDWAFTADSSDVCVYRVTRPKRCSCEQSARDQSGDYAY
jgi:hypothetical protein